jgi:hypothetical protein
MIEAPLEGVEFIAVNTDAQALRMSDATSSSTSAGSSPVASGRGQPRDRPQGRRGAPHGDHRGPRLCRPGLRHRGRGRRHRHRRCARRRHRPQPRRANHWRGHPPVHLRTQAAQQAEDGIRSLREECATALPCATATARARRAACARGARPAWWTRRGTSGGGWKVRDAAEELIASTERRLSDPPLVHTVLIRGNSSPPGQQAS